MKQYTIAVFNSRPDAEKTIDRLHSEVGIDTSEISYLYRNTNDEVKEVSADDVSTSTPAEGAADGAIIGGSIGALAGLATVAGLIPVIGPIFAAGPLVSALGLGAGALGTAAAGGVTGAAAGGLIGALVSWSSGSITEAKAKEYEDQIMGGNVLVAVHGDDTDNIEQVCRECGAISIDSYQPAI